VFGLPGIYLAQVSPTVETIDRLARTPMSQILIFAGICTLVRLAVSPTLAKTPPHRRGGSYKFLKFLNESGDALVYAAILVFLLVRPFAIQTFTIPTPSMVDTLNVGDAIVANKWVYRTADPKVGEIVVFSPPAAGVDERTPNADYIKRCVGVPGEVIEIRDSKLYRNGVAVDEPYEMRTTQMATQPVPKANYGDYPLPDYKLVNDNGKYIPLTIMGDFANASPLTAPTYQISDPAEMKRLMALPAAAIPPGYYMMMGDNRNGSYDSRAWGLVPREKIVGRCEIIWLPFSRAGRPKND
jgi:signal peptidase I